MVAIWDFHWVSGERSMVIKLLTREVQSMLEARPERTVPVVDVAIFFAFYETCLLLARAAFSGAARVCNGPWGA